MIVALGPGVGHSLNDIGGALSDTEIRFLRLGMNDTVITRRVKKRVGPTSWALFRMISKCERLSVGAGARDISLLSSPPFGGRLRTVAPPAEPAP
jgi:hypothetical protein